MMMARGGKGLPGEGKGLPAPGRCGRPIAGGTGRLARFLLAGQGQAGDAMAMLPGESTADAQQT